jgi:calcineurin-like phosphoesterase family protein
MTQYFTSDHHFHHFNIIGYCNRPFADVQDQTEKMIESWNSVVTDEDTVWHLGDFSFKGYEMVKRLNGHKKIVAGNHDAFWLGNVPEDKPARESKRFKAHQDAVDSGFEFVYASGRFENLALHDGTRVDLAHLPFEIDPRGGEREQRFKRFRPKRQGRVLLCGHVHDAWTVSGDQINVGVDVHDFIPVSEYKITEMIGAM